jgi:hypothetical protein
MMDASLISRLAFLMAAGLASFAGSAVLGRLFVKQPERLRVALWWLLAVILALSCAWVNGNWPFPPRESQHWIGYVLLFSALLRSIPFPTAQLISALAGATLAIVVTLLPIAQNGWGPLMFGTWFFASLLSYLISDWFCIRNLKPLLCAGLCCSPSLFSFPQSCCFLLGQQCWPSLQSQVGLRSQPPISLNVPRRWVAALSRLHCFSTFCCCLTVPFTLTCPFVGLAPMDRPCARHPFGAAAASRKMDDATRALYRHGRGSRSRRMCGSVTLLLRGKTDGTLLRLVNQARLANSPRAVEPIGFQRRCRLPCNGTLNETMRRI